jgi:hypothetical protein
MVCGDVLKNLVFLEVVFVQGAKKNVMTKVKRLGRPFSDSRKKIYMAGAK